MRAHRRAQSARPQGMSLANLLREAKGGACPPVLRSFVYMHPARVHAQNIETSPYSTIRLNILTSLVNDEEYCSDCKDPEKPHNREPCPS